MPTLTHSCAVVFGIAAVLYVFGIAGIAGVLHVFGIAGVLYVFAIAGIAMHPVKGGGCTSGAARGSIFANHDLLLNPFTAAATLYLSFYQ